jgi:HAD superfamily hydrolase (TIGR01509 family)
MRSTLDADAWITAVTSADDAGKGKPDPATVRTALDRAGAVPGGAVFVGDTVRDVQAAHQAGVPCIGLLSGG